MIPLSRRELRSAWVSAHAASRVAARTNAHRLLLFYAIECGLKAAWLKRANRELLDEHILDAGSGKPVAHDLNKMLDLLLAGKELRLPASFALRSLNRPGGLAELVRRPGTGELNQAWRYGATLEPPDDDQVFEAALERVHVWLQGELR